MMTGSALGWAIAAWLLAINAVTYLAFHADKARARDGRRRIAERDLLWLAAAGGSPAALLARRRLRHKTRKQPFGAWLTLVVVVQVAAVIGLAVLVGRA
jgi:uncharacterized membrane protein YsdA (DUF1294 family)